MLWLIFKNSNKKKTHIMAVASIITLGQLYPPNYGLPKLILTLLHILLSICSLMTDRYLGSSLTFHSDLSSMYLTVLITPII